MTSTTTAVNVDLLRQGVEWVEEQAELPIKDQCWWQGEWRSPGPDAYPPRTCGTTYCLAGYVCTAAGGRWVKDRTMFYLRMEDADRGRTLLYGHDDRPELPKRGLFVTAEGRARRLLGLAPHEADELFRSSNSSEDVRRIAERIARQKL